MIITKTKNILMMKLLQLKLKKISILLNLSHFLREEKKQTFLKRFWQKKIIGE